MGISLDSSRHASSRSEWEVSPQGAFDDSGLRREPNAGWSGIIITANYARRLHDYRFSAILTPNMARSCDHLIISSIGLGELGWGELPAAKGSAEA
jgi:hypothetical protein